MPRWLLALLFTVALSCFGVASFGQVQVDASHHPEYQHDEPAPVNPASSLLQGEALQAESVLDNPELLDALQAPETVAPHGMAAQRLQLLSLPRPFLAGLERPPRAHALAS